MAHATPDEDRAFLSAVCRYWRTAHSDYLNHVGNTFQAGFLYPADVPEAASQSNVRLAYLAGITEGALVLDAGCGVCGPAIDIARAIPSVRITGVTVSPEQGASAHQLIRTAGLARSIHVTVSDYHQLPFHSDTFEIACLFESAVYSNSIDVLFSELFRVLRPGGALYIKDVYLKATPLSEQARRDVDEFDRTFACKVRTVDAFVTSIARAGFDWIVTRDLTPEIRTGHTQRAMFNSGDPRLGLTAFGRRHFRLYRELPLYFAEIKAVRAENRTSPKF
jgi:cyclopropane fatty-acyl-phospholipid synthase-like methyltransferase